MKNQEGTKMNIVGQGAGVRQETMVAQIRVMTARKEERERRYLRRNIKKDSLL